MTTRAGAALVLFIVIVTISSASPALGAGEAESSQPARLRGLQFSSTDASTTVTLDLDNEVRYRCEQLTDPPRWYIDLLDTRIGSRIGRRRIPVNQGLLKRIRLGEHENGVTRVVFDLESPVKPALASESDPPRLVAELGRPAAAASAPSRRPAPVMAASAASASRMRRPFAPRLLPPATLEIDGPAPDAGSVEGPEVLTASAPKAAAAPKLAPPPKLAKPGNRRRMRVPIANLVVGQRIKIEGKKFKDQKLVADKIELVEENDDYEIEGPISKLDIQAGTFALGPVGILIYEKTKVENSSRQPSSIAALTEGLRVKVKAKRLKGGFVKARTIRIYADSADRDFEIEAPVESVSVGNSEVRLLALRVKVDNKTEYKNFGFVEIDKYADGVGRYIRRDDDEQHPDPIRIGGVYIGGRVRMGFESTRNLDLNEEDPDSDDWLAPSTRLEVSVPIGEYSEAYARVDFRNANYFGNNPTEQSRTASGFERGSSIGETSCIAHWGYRSAGSAFETSGNGSSTSALTP